MVRSPAIATTPCETFVPAALRSDGIRSSSSAHLRHTHARRGYLAVSSTGRLFRHSCAGRNLRSGHGLAWAWVFGGADAALEVA